MVGAGDMRNSEDTEIFSVTPFDTKSSVIKLSDAVIGGLKLDDVWANRDGKSVNFEVYGGLRLGSTQKEVEKVFGKPSSTVELDTVKSYTYSSDGAYRE